VLIDHERRRRDVAEQTRVRAPQVPTARRIRGVACSGPFGLPAT
jgi:hypothetical protein